MTLKESSDDVIVELDRTKINSIGMKCIGDFLLKIQVYKSTGDVTPAIEMYTKYTSVDDQFLRLRNIVLAQKKPRQLMVQVVTDVVEVAGDAKKKTVELKEFDASVEGLCDSFAARFPAEDLELLRLAKMEASMHP